MNNKEDIKHSPKAIALIYLEKAKELFTTGHVDDARAQLEAGLSWVKLIKEEIKE